MWILALTVLVLLVWWLLYVAGTLKAMYEEMQAQHWRANEQAQQIVSLLRDLQRT